jgi:subtilisin family serine protease
VRIFWAAVVIGVTLAIVAAQPAMPQTSEPAELIVRFEPGVTAPEREEVRDDAGTEFQEWLPVPRMQVVEVDAGQSASAAERELESADGVAYAEPNAVRSTFLRTNDPYLSNLWALENTGQSIRGVTGKPDADADVTEAWDAGIRGSVVVAVIDTGADPNHPDLKPNLWRNAGESGLGRESNGIDDDVNGRVDDWRGWDFVGGDNDPTDENGHGTHVSGTIAADRANAVGVAGIADGAAKVMPIRVLDANGSGRVSDVIQAYSYAFNEGASVVNLSLGSTASSRAEHDAIAAFPNMLFVAAAGNGGADGVGDNNDSVATYPCAYLLPNVICVAASDNRDQLASFSNYGATSVDLAAPGVNIASTWPGGGYSWSNGTSMATPHVSAAAAILKAAAPGALPPNLASALMSGTDAAPAFTGKTVSGGRLNVLRSLRSVADVSVGEPAPAPAPANGSGSGSGSGSPAVADRVAPRLSIRRGRLARSVLLRRGLALRLRSSEACTVRVSLRFHGRPFARSVRTSLTRTRSKRVRLRMTARGRRLLHRSRSLKPTLVVRATDRSGNRRTVRIRLSLSR